MSCEPGSWRLYDAGEMPGGPLEELARSADESYDSEVWHFRCPQHKTMFPVDDVCPKWDGTALVANPLRTESAMDARALANLEALKKM